MTVLLSFEEKQMTLARAHTWDTVPLSHARAIQGISFNLDFFILFTVVIFPEFVKLSMLFFVTLYAHFINKRDAHSYSVFCDYLD